MGFYATGAAGVYVSGIDASVCSTLYGVRRGLMREQRALLGRTARARARWGSLGGLCPAGLYATSIAMLCIISHYSDIIYM